jgi:hypothetical protein
MSTRGIIMPNMLQHHIGHKSCVIEAIHLKSMGLAQAFNLAITPCVEHKRSKKVRHTTKSLGMEINDSKKANFKFDSPKTFNDADFNLLDPSITFYESRPRSASCMASNNQAYTTTTSSGILSLDERVLDSANKEFEIKLMPFKDDRTQLKLMEHQPSNYMDGVLEEPKVLSLPRIEPLKADHGLVEVDHSNPPNSDT